MKLAIPSRLVFALLLSAAISAESSSDGAATTDHNLALRNSSSPYLQQHADNPVAWLPYSPDLISNIQSQQKLVFLSIGYSTCHWCHVMNRESFQDMEVAQVLNKSFISVKMDREQYPDADQYYNGLLVLSGGTAGWPLSGILLPDGTPVWLGNYVKKERLIALLTAFSEHFERDSPDIEMQAGIYRDLIIKNAAANRSQAESQGTTDLQQLGEELLARQDPRYGGIAGEQKFPNPDNIEMLWWFYDETRDVRFEIAAIKHLDGMLEGALYDPLQGGFFRYATSPDWHQPHFEKMLYTQAQMLGVYTNAFRRTGNQRYFFVADDTYKFIKNKFRHPDVPAFVAAFDSEASGKNGGAYTFEIKSIDEFCQPDLCTASLSEDGTGYLVSTSDYTPENLTKIRFKYREILGNAERSHKRDLKVLVGWNAILAIAMHSYENLDKRSHSGPESLSSQLVRLLKDESWSLNGRFLLRQIMSETQVEASQSDYLAFSQMEIMANVGSNTDVSNVSISDKQIALLISSLRAGHLGPQLGWVVPHIYEY